MSQNIVPIKTKASGEGIVGWDSTQASSFAPMVVNDAMVDQYMSGLSFDDRVAILHEMEQGNELYNGRRVAQDDLANGSLFFTRSLEFMMSQPFDVQYEDLPARSMFPVVNEGGPGIQKITAEVYDSFGKAKLINQGAKDIPFVDAGGKEISYNVGMFGVGARWTIQELHAYGAATRNGRGRRSPQQSRQKAAVRAVEEAINEQALFGTEEIGIPGFIEHPNIPRGTVAPGASGTTRWEDKTADEILADLNDLTTSVWVDTKMIERPNMYAIAPSSFKLLTERRLDNRDISIMTYFLENSRFFTSIDQFIPINEYEGTGTGGTNRITAYTKSQDKLRLEIPQEMQNLPVQQNMFTYMMLYYVYSAGVMVLYPRSAAHADGI